MNALPIIIGALCVIAISYRYYSAFKQYVNSSIR